MLKHPLDVVKIMTPFPHTIDSSADLAEAGGMMLEHDISFLPVVEAQNLVGILTRRDIDLATSLLSEEQRAGLRVRDLCRFDPYIVETHERAATVIAHMCEHNLSSALVVKHGRVVGIVTCSNVYELLLRYMQGKSGSDNIPDIPA